MCVCVCVCVCVFLCVYAHVANPALLWMATVSGLRPSARNQSGLPEVFHVLRWFFPLFSYRFLPLFPTDCRCIDRPLDLAHREGAEDNPELIAMLRAAGGRATFDN